MIEALQTGLRELGYVEGKNLKVEYRDLADHSPNLSIRSLQSSLSSVSTRSSPRARMLLSPRSERPRRYRS